MAEDTSMPSVIVDIVPDGDVLLDATFETSAAVLRAARKEAKSLVSPPRPSRAGTRAAAARVVAQPPPAFAPVVRVGFRVRLETLKRQSNYFNSLLSNAQFAEARAVTAAFERLSLRGVPPFQADAKDLPLVKIAEDDETTETAARDALFRDMLLILHEKDAATKPVAMRYLAALLILADRFDCVAPLAKSFARFRFKWPVTLASRPTQMPTDMGGPGPALSRAAEEMLRQKILVSWRCAQPQVFRSATRDLIRYGSRIWNAGRDDDHDHNDENLAKNDSYQAAWWHLPDGLEEELHHRRHCILNTIASVQQHFLRLYTTRGARQCKLGYASSIACDSFQLGEMLKFLLGKGLLSLGDVSRPGDHVFAHSATADLEAVLSALRECPSYQVDRDHTNCGLRLRMMPIIDYIQARLASPAVSPSWQEWSKDQKAASWHSPEELRDYEDAEPFRFTRSVFGGCTTPARGSAGWEHTHKDVIHSEFMGLDTRA